MLERFVKLTGSIAKPSDATAYTSGDHIANSLTGASVTPMTFALPNGFISGRLTGARAVATPASGNLVITAFDFDLLLFRGETNIPFAAGGYPADNAALTLTQAIYRQLVGVFAFANGAWRNPLGALTAGAVGWQAVGTTGRTTGYTFGLDSAANKSLIGVLQAKGTWTPTAVAQTIDIDLDLEVQ